jgi:succinate dehydrogenase/fumarate reductase cytochrome b subunit
MKESTVMLVQYMTGVVIIVLGALHFALLTFAGGGLENALTFNSVVTIYTSFGLVLELFLTLLTFHIFNGFRKMLVELRQGVVYERVVTWLMVAAGAVTFLWGTRTILIFLGVI